MEFEVYIGDITELEVDVIVNAANPRLLGGGGVDGAIHRAAGPGLLEECRALPQVRPGARCPTGEARITGGHGLRARWVVHTVGPVWGEQAEGESDRLLASCYVESLRLAARAGAASIAFPAVSTGVYGYPKSRAARVAVDAVRGSGVLMRVVFCCYSEGDAGVYAGVVGEG
jgi:O-acetyl-ADP-ribose deacetylase